MRINIDVLPSLIHAAWGFVGTILQDAKLRHKHIFLVSVCTERGMVYIKVCIQPPGIARHYTRIVKQDIFVSRWTYLSQELIAEIANENV